MIAYLISIVFPFQWILNSDNPNSHDKYNKTIFSLFNKGHFVIKLKLKLLLIFSRKDLHCINYVFSRTHYTVKIRGLTI